MRESTGLLTMGQSCENLIHVTKLSCWFDSTKCFRLITRRIVVNQIYTYIDIKWIPILSKLIVHWMKNIAYTQVPLASVSRFFAYFFRCTAKECILLILVSNVPDIYIRLKWQKIQARRAYKCRTFLCIGNIGGFSDIMLNSLCQWMT